VAERCGKRSGGADGVSGEHVAVVVALGLQAPFWVVAALLVAAADRLWPTICSSSRLLERREAAAPAGRPYRHRTTPDHDAR
jgi:hypothetical protein